MLENLEAYFESHETVDQGFVKYVARELLDKLRTAQEAQTSAIQLQSSATKLIGKVAGELAELAYLLENYHEKPDAAEQVRDLAQLLEDHVQRETR